MTAPTPQTIAAALVLALLLAASHLLDGPSDPEAAQDVADALAEAAQASTSQITTLNHLPAKAHQP